MRVEAKDGGKGTKSVSKSASQLTFLCSATIRCSVQSRITSLHERLALSRIKEESAHVGEVKCHHSTAGGIKGAAVGSLLALRQTEKDLLCSALLCVDSTETTH